MFAVIKTGGKQYRVAESDVIVVEKLAGEAGGAIAFEEVLLIGDGADITVGAALAGASVTGELVEQRRGDKIKIFKKRRRNTYRRKNGHRQAESVVRITSIAGKSGGKS
jgi:large subunit ribosomal protein L21